MTDSALSIFHRATRSSIAAITAVIWGLLACLTAHATGFCPIISNYTASSYNAGLQNWSIAQAQNGDIYVGNNMGLLRFNGYEWTRYSLPTCQIVRSILPVGNRIYAGTYEEFGYFEKDAFGQLIYHSLSSGLKKFKMHEDDIWNIIAIGKDVYFQSFSSWFKYDGKRVYAHYNDNLHPLYFHEVHGKIYVQMINGDFYALDGDRYRLLFSRRAVADDNVVAIIPLAGDRMILCTEWHGLYDYDGRTLSRRVTKVDDALCHQQINRATLVYSDSTIVIGTILNGIYGISPQGTLKWHYNVTNRLHTNSVLRLLCDRDNNIWAALDNGITLIHTGSPYAVLLPDVSAPAIGMVYGVAFDRGLMYIATNQGVYNYTPASGNFSMIGNTNGQNWHVTHFDSQILIGNNTQTKKIIGNTAIPIPRTSGSSTCISRCRINEQDILLESSYGALRIYRLVGGNWTVSHEVTGFNAPIRHFEVDESGTIWAAHMSRGIYRIELSKDLSHVTLCKQFLALAPNGAKGTMSVMKIRGRVVLSDYQSLYTYDDITRRIIPLTKLNALLSAPVVSASPIDGNTFWLATSSGYIMVRYDASGSYRILQSIPASFFGSESNEVSNDVFTAGGMSYFFMNNQVGRFDINATLVPPNRLNQLEIASVTSTDHKLIKHLLPIVGEKHDNVEAFGDITFHLSYPNYNSLPIRFRYTLSGALDVKSESSSPVVSFSALGYGNYHFTATATDNTGRILGRVEYHFSVPRPIYLSAFAFLIYFVALFTVGYFIARWRAAKTLEHRRKEFEAEKLSQDLKMLEQDKIIAQQQQQLLESELSSKGKELASLALDVVAKDKAIESFRESVRQQQERGNLTKDNMRSLLLKLNAQVDNREFWNIYQKNFDLIHENFFRNLRARYPSLTSSDLKFCAFLRLNLTSKEIGQFTNLTLRGVEAARYRLRKKFALPEGTSLVDFLIDFK